MTRDKAERLYAEITRDLLQRSDHRSVQALERDLRNWVKAWNENPKPFIWTKTADQILDSLGRPLQRTTAACVAAACAPRSRTGTPSAPPTCSSDFTATAPNLRWVADFTYVRTWAGFVYVSFVIDCFSRAIVGWHASTSKTTPLVTTALRMGLWRRAGPDTPQPTGSSTTAMRAVKFAETLAMEGIAASLGSIGDAYDCQSVSAGSREDRVVLAGTV